MFIDPVITDTQYCMTIHHFGRHGRTKFVTKRCASFNDCNLTGCQHHANTLHVVSPHTHSSSCTHLTSHLLLPSDVAIAFSK